MERHRRTGRRASDMQAALLDAVRRGRFRQAQLLVEAGAGVDGSAGERAEEETPLLACVTRLPQGEARDKLLRLLLDAGADANAVDGLGRCALMHAAILGQTDTVQELLDNPGVDLELEDVGGNTAIMHAARHGHAEVVAALLRQMGRLRQILHLSQRNRAGRTAVELAQRHGHVRVAAALGCCAPKPPTTANNIISRPTFPRPMTDDDGGADADHFPNPRQLERGPTPGSPLLSFPARWQQRQQRRRAEVESPPEATDDEEEDDFRIDSPVNHPESVVTEKLIRRVPVQFEPSGTGLPRLRQSDRRRGEAFIDLNSSYGSCRSVDSSGYESSDHKSGSSGWMAPSAAGSVGGGREADEPLPPGHDRFRRVLNLLDAAIQEDEVDPPGKGSAGVGAGTVTESKPAIAAERSRASNRHRLVVGKSNYFPPVRQLRPVAYSTMPDRVQPRPVVPPIGHRNRKLESGVGEPK